MAEDRTIKVNNEDKSKFLASETQDPARTNQNDQQNSKKPLIKEEVHFSIKPKKIFKGIFIVLLFVVIFFAGRWSTDIPALDSLNFLNHEDKISGAVTTEQLAEPLELQAAPVEETKQEIIEEPIVVEEEPEQEESDEEVITEYKAVGLTFDDIKIDWKETWGKVSHVTFTINNAEAGTIKPEQLVLTMEKYDKTVKDVPLPLSLQQIKSKTKDSRMLQVPGGFGYSEITLGKLDNVRLTLTLKDESDKEIAKASETFNLQG